MILDPFHPAPKPARPHPNKQMVHALRISLKGKTTILNPPDDRDAGLQTNELPLSKSPLTQFHNFKIIYKRYAGLYFALCIDVNDN